MLVAERRRALGVNNAHSSRYQCQSGSRAVRASDQPRPGPPRASQIARNARLTYPLLIHSIVVTFTPGWCGVMADLDLSETITVRCESGRVGPAGPESREGRARVKNK
ncbi:unnamed protein product [Boreogadus saida]